MTIVQNELDDLKERKLTTEMYNSKDTINVINPPECQNGDLLGTIFSFFNSNLQYELSPCVIKNCNYLGKPQKSSVIGKFVYFVQKNFIGDPKKVWRASSTKTG